MNSVPEDVFRLMVAYFRTGDVLKIRCATKTTRLMCQYHTPMYPILGRLRYWKASFPHMTSATFREPRTLIEEDFVHMKDVDTLSMNSRVQAFDISYFNHLPKLTSLDTQGCKFKLTLQPAFLKLTHLSVDHSNAPSDDDLRQLTNLTYLSIRSVSGATNYGLETLTNLRVLDLYQLDLTDEVCKYLPNLEELSMTFCLLSAQGISQFKKLTTLYVIGGKNMKTLEGLEQLPLLHTVHITYCEIHDSDLRYLPHVRRLVLYSTSRIRGHGLCELKHLEYLALYELSLQDEDMDCLLDLPANIIYMYRCREVSSNKKKELTNQMKGRFHTDLIRSE